MGCCWRTWPCTPCSSARASLTPTRPGGASTVGESQPTTEDPDEEAGERLGGWKWRGELRCRLVWEDGQGGAECPASPGPLPIPHPNPQGSHQFQGEEQIQVPSGCFAQ